MAITPKHWAEFQHYKNRSPAWIKLHRKLLDDFAFSRLPLASRALAPLLWLLASEYHGGKITASVEEIAFRLRVTKQDIQSAIKPLIDSGFFDADSTVLAECLQDACLEREEEEEEEEEIEVESLNQTTIESVSSIRTISKKIDAAKIFDDQFWLAYPKRDGANPKAPARRAFISAVKSGADPDTIISGALRYAADLSRSGKVGSAYVAQAITWLRQKRWGDYPEEIAVSAHDPPRPPDPRMPSHDELTRKYGGSNADDRGNPKQGSGLRPTSDGFRREDGYQTAKEASDDQTGLGGVAGMGTLFPGLPELPAVGNVAGSGSASLRPNGHGDDGSSAVAGVVRRGLPSV